MSNQLVAIGHLGQNRVYLNVSPEEAKRRYEETYKDVNWDYEEVRLIDFDEEFEVYDVWWFPEVER